jgi:small subunit ribosomal protein S1
VVTPGEEKWVRILEIDEERRRISLSIKRAETKNNAFTDLIPDELKQQVQDASDDAAAAAAAEEAGESTEAAEPVTEAATEAPADEVPDLGLSEDVFSEAPVAPAPEEAPPTESDEG